MAQYDLFQTTKPRYSVYRQWLDEAGSHAMEECHTCFWSRVYQGKYSCLHFGVGISAELPDEGHCTGCNEWKSRDDFVRRRSNKAFWENRG